jgi:ankyrin repeat protein
MGMTYSEEQKQLITAARNGDVETIQKLIDAGFDIDCELKYSATALILAAARGHNEICQMLIKAGAKVNRRNRFGATPLLEATEKGHLLVMKTLVEMGAEINLPHNNGNTPLLTATMRRERKTIKMLLELGADPEVSNFDGWTARGWAEAESDFTIQALFGIKKQDHENSYQASVRKDDDSARPRQAKSPVQDTFWTVFMRAASTGDIETVRRLAGDGIEVNGQSPNGTTALMAAVKNGHADVAFELIDLGADVDLADSEGLTAIEWAKRKGQVVIINGLEERCAATAECQVGRTTSCTQ